MCPYLKPRLHDIKLINHEAGHFVYVYNSEILES